MKKVFVLLLMISIIACSKDDDNTVNFLDCNDFDDNFKIYTGEDLECRFYYTLTEFDNQKFIELNSECADISPSVINENCEEICPYDLFGEDSPCGKYLRGREVLEIHLIEK